MRWSSHWAQEHPEIFIRRKKKQNQREEQKKQNEHEQMEMLLWGVLAERSRAEWSKVMDSITEWGFKSWPVKSWHLCPWTLYHNCFSPSRSTNANTKNGHPSKSWPQSMALNATLMPLTLTLSKLSGTTSISFDCQYKTGTELEKVTSRNIVDFIGGYA